MLRIAQGSACGELQPALPHEVPALTLALTLTLTRTRTRTRTRTLTRYLFDAFGLSPMAAALNHECDAALYVSDHADTQPPSDTLALPTASAMPTLPPCLTN